MKIDWIPKEHGAYVVAAAAWLLGVIDAPSVDPAGAGLSLLTVASVFLALGPLRLWQQSRRTGRDAGRRAGWLRIACTLLATASATGILLALRFPPFLWMGLPAALVAILYLAAARRRKGMIDMSKIGFAGLALAAPAARISAGTGWTPMELAGLWLLASLFFLGSVYCVNIRMAGRSAVPPALCYHGIYLTATIVLVALGVLPAAAVAMLLLALLRLLWIVSDVERYRARSLKSIGVQESVVVLLYLTIGLLGSR